MSAVKIINSLREAVEIERVRNALLQFAVMAGAYDKPLTWRDDDPVTWRVGPPGDATAYRITVGDLRRARDLLKTMEGE